jgi:hypothetical protein
MSQCNTWSPRVPPLGTALTLPPPPNPTEFSVIFSVSANATNTASLFVTVDPDDASPVARADRFSLALYRLAAVNISSMGPSAFNSTLVAQGKLTVALAPDQVLPSAVFGLIVSSSASASISSSTIRISVSLLDVVVVSAVDTPVLSVCRAVGAPTYVRLTLPTPPPMFAQRIDARAVSPLMGSSCIKTTGWPAFQCFGELLSRRSQPLLSLLHDNVDDVNAADGAILRVCAVEQMLVTGSIRDCRALAIAAGAASVRSARAVVGVNATMAADAVWESCPTLTLCGASECRRGAIAAATSDLWSAAATVPSVFDTLCGGLSDAEDRLVCVQGIGAGVVEAIYDGECQPQVADNRTIVGDCALAASVATAPNDTAAAFTARCLRGAFEAVLQNCALNTLTPAAFAQFSGTACDAYVNASAVHAQCIDALGAVVALRASYNVVDVASMCNNVTVCADAAKAEVARVVARDPPVRSGPCSGMRVPVDPIGVMLPLFDGLGTWIPLESASMATAFTIGGGGVDMRFAIRATLVPLVTASMSSSSSSSSQPTTTSTTTTTTTAPTTSEGPTAPQTLGPVPTYTMSRGCKAHCELFCGSTAAALCVCAGQRISCAHVPGVTDRAIHGANGDVDSAVAPNTVSNAAWLVPLVVFGALALVGVGACAAALARHRRNNAFSRRRL